MRECPRGCIKLVRCAENLLHSTCTWEKVFVFGFFCFFFFLIFLFIYDSHREKEREAET